MRTVGTFDLIFKQAGQYDRGIADRMDIPLDPVIRREAGEWAIDSALLPAYDCDFECSLDAFCEYWFSNSDGSVSPDQSDIDYWISLFDFETE